VSGEELCEAWFVTIILNMLPIDKNGEAVKRFVLGFVLMAGATSALAQDGFMFQPLVAGEKPANGVTRDTHASTVVELEDGDVMAAWFGGTAEGANDVVIHGARLHNGEWGPVVELARADGVATWNPVLFHTKDGKLWLYYKYGTKPTTWKGRRKWSTDEGKTWSAEEDLPEGILGPIRAKPLILDDGTIVSGSSVENGKWNAWIERSTDNGKTWTKFGPITVPESLDIPDAGAIAASQQVDKPVPSEAIHTKLYPPAKETTGIIQPVVVPMGGHHLRFFARSHTKAQRIAIADSMDDGKTWTQARFIDVPNPSAGIDIVRLKDGRYVLIYNNSYNTRTPINLAVSTDGEHFRMFKVLEDTPGQFSYPALVQAKNGDLLMTYSYQRKTIKFVRLPLAEVPAK
jgi:predicted neuraminidase